MKKFMICLFVISCLSVQAQKINFGAKAGVNFANFTGDDDSFFDGATGFYVGGLAEIPLGKFMIQPELLYSIEGADFNSALENADFDFGYLRVPVKLKRKIIGGLNIVTGPEFGFIIDDKDAEDVKTFEFAIGLGAEYYFKNKIGIEARYINGLTDVADNIDLKQKTFQLGLAYKF